MTANTHNKPISFSPHSLFCTVFSAWITLPVLLLYSGPFFNLSIPVTRIIGQHALEMIVVSLLQPHTAQLSTPQTHSV